jgi:hypothetical protein
MTPRDILAPSLTGEKRVTAGGPVLRRVFTDNFYDIFVALYSGGLLATLVYYKRENLRIMARLGEAPSLSSDRDAWTKAAVGILKAAQKGPFHLVRDSKLECQLTLTLHDRAALKLAGVDVPKSAGRYREMFGHLDKGPN